MMRTDFTVPAILAEVERQLGTSDIIKLTRGQWLAILTELVRAQAQADEP